MAVTIGVVRILANHWQLVWAVVALILGIVFATANMAPVQP